MEGSYYEGVFKSNIGEIIKLPGGRYRLLCYNITSTREEMIMVDLGHFITQTNSVMVGDFDPLDGISWFSGDFLEENLDETVDYLQEVCNG